jgi:hypothetical protein
VNVVRFPKREQCQNREEEIPNPVVSFAIIILLAPFILLFAIWGAFVCPLKGVAK